MNRSQKKSVIAPSIQPLLRSVVGPLRRPYVSSLGSQDFQLPAEQRYHQAVGEWLAAGRQLPAEPATITVKEVLGRFWTHAEQYYRTETDARDTWLERVGRFNRWPDRRYRELHVAAQPLEDLGIACVDRDNLGMPLISEEGCERLSEAGAIRIVLLGSQTITHIHATLGQIAAGGAERPDMDHLDWDDPQPHRLLSEGALDQTLDLLDWDLIVRRKLLRQIGPQRLADLMAAPALMYRARERPALMEQYVRQKNGAAWEAPHPIVQAHLAETYGLLLYDEQFAAILDGVTGWGMWSNRTRRLQDSLRHGDQSAVVKFRNEFLAAAKGRDIAFPEAEGIWDVLAANGGMYCKAAAVGFAVTVFQAAYLATHFPEAFAAPAQR